MPIHKLLYDHIFTYSIVKLADASEDPSWQDINE
jgi:hypothetical protein